MEQPHSACMLILHHDSTPWLRHSAGAVELQTTRCHVDPTGLHTVSDQHTQCAGRLHCTVVKHTCWSCHAPPGRASIIAQRDSC
jgi:hypothetical protein